MSRPRNAVPVPRNHKGRAVLDVYEAGTRRTRTLGAWGSPEAEAAYKVFLAHFAAGNGPQPTAADVTVNEILPAFLGHAERHYRHADGRPTSEVNNLKMAIRPLRELYGLTSARAFGPRSLKAVRDHMVGLQWCRNQVNSSVGRLKRVFKWAASEELVPAAVFQSLQSVAGLRAGRSAARETAPVGPVDDEVVDATLPYLTRHVRGLLLFQQLTGCRPGEACVLRRLDVDCSGSVWVFRPKLHKNAHRGKPRVIPIGPRAQELLAEFWPIDPNAFVFSPAESVTEIRRSRAAARATPRFPSHVERNASKRVTDPQRVPGARYTSASLGHAIRRAIDRANADQCRDPRYGPVLPPIPDWHANQLRHAVGTKVRKGHGLEAAQVLLGHSRADVTQVYAERNEALAAEIANEIG